MSGDVNHFFNWVDVGYLFGLYGHPHAGDTAIFSEYGQPNVYYRESQLGPKFLPDLIKFDRLAQTYHLTIMDDLSMKGAPSGQTNWPWSSTNSEAWGIKNESAHRQHVHVVDQATLEFKGESSALTSGSANTVVYHIGNSDDQGTMIFRNNASAGGASINLDHGSQLHFYDKKSWKCYNYLADGAQLKFSGNASANSATIVLGDTSHLKFSDKTSAGKAKITLNDGSQVDFVDHASAGQSVIALKNGSSVNVTGNSSLGSAVLSLEGSTLTSDHDMALTSISADSNSHLKIGGTLSVDHQDNQEILAKISDHGTQGTIVKQGAGVLTLSGNNAHTGGIVVKEGGLRISKDANLGHSSGNLTLHDGTTLELADHSTSNRSIQLKDGVQTIDTGVSTVALSGKIEGNGKLTKKGSGKLVLSGAETRYTGGTLVSDGILEGDTRSLQGSIENNAVVNFNQIDSGNFQGQLKGKGNTIKAGGGTLNVVSDNGDFKGTVYVQEGRLALNNRLGGNVVVHTAGIISGTGKVLGDLLVRDGGTVSPGNSIGVLQVNGNYAQANSTYHVQVNGEGQSSLLNVHGTAILEGASVLNVTSVDGRYSTTGNYQILHADGGVQGEFATVVVEDSRAIPNLTYDANNVYLDFIKSFGGIAATPEEKEIIDALDQGRDIAVSVPPIIDTIMDLSDSNATRAFQQLSAQQYTNILTLAEMTNQQFIRRLYDPLRSIVTDHNCYDDCWCCSCCDCGYWDCRNRDCSCCDCGYCDSDCGESWIEAGAARSFFKGNECVRGSKSKGYQITFGHQKRLDRCWTVGAAGSYEHDNISYNLSGRNKVNTFFGALYGLYRPCSYYVLGDLAFGYSNQRLKRHIDIGSIRCTTRGKPKVFSSTLYVEAGKDIDCQCRFLLIQPFVGLDASYYRRNRVHEHGISPLNMQISDKSYGTLHSRLGVHLTTHRLRCLVVSVDLAWNIVWLVAAIAFMDVLPILATALQLKDCEFVATALTVL